MRSIYRRELLIPAFILAASMALSACGNKEEKSVETSTEVTAVAATGETYPGTVEATDSTGSVSGNFGIMHATVLGIQPDETEGIDIYNLQDKNDTENMWSIPADQIGSIDADMSVGSEVAVAFKGDMINDYENVEFIAVIPAGNYMISSVEGTTLVNVMSTFSIKADDGTEMTFLKDNCEIEEDAMTGDSGERVCVYYAGSSDGINYPLAVYKGE